MKSWKTAVHRASRVKAATVATAVPVAKAAETVTVAADATVVLAVKAEIVALSAAIADHQAMKERNTPREIEATKLTPAPIRRLRPARRGDAERALARLDQHVLAATAHE